jgi:hypothetical protein
MFERIKRTSLINGMTGETTQRNYIVSVGPWFDVHSDIVSIVAHIYRPGE